MFVVVAATPQVKIHFSPRGEPEFRCAGLKMDRTVVDYQLLSIQAQTRDRFTQRRFQMEDGVVVRTDPHATLYGNGIISLFVGPRVDARRNARPLNKMKLPCRFAIPGPESLAGKFKIL